MQRIKVQSPAFVQPKGLQVSNKDAVMEKVEEVVSEKVVELVESKTEEIEKKVEETTDKVLYTVQENTQKVADKVEEAVKPIADLIDDNPAVKKVLDGTSESIVEKVDGREFSCFCFGWLLSLKISRKLPQSSPSTQAVIDNKLPELPPQHEVVKESPPPKVETESQSTPSKEETSVSA